MQQRLDPAGPEERQRREEVHEPDALVVGRRQPAEHAAGRSVQMRSRRSMRATACAACRRWPSLLQALEVGGDRARSPRPSRSSAGMRSPGLTCCGSRIQRSEVGGRLGIVSAASEVRARHVREVGADLSARAASRGSRGSWRTRCRGRAARPRAAAGRRRAQPRARPAGAARRGTSRGGVGARRTSPCARAGARRTRRTGRGSGPAWSAYEQQPVRVPGDHVDLAVELRDPEAVDDVGRASRRRSRACPTGMWISFAVTAAVPG